MFGQVRVVRVTHTNSPADRSPARVQRWPSAGTSRGQYAGSALLRNEAVHSVLPGPRAVSCLVFVRAKRATDSSTTVNACWTYVEEVAGIMDNVTAGVHRPQPFLLIVKDA